MADIKLKDRSGAEMPYSGVTAVQIPDENGEPVTFKIPATQHKTVDITENGAQTITPDAGYDGLSEVTVSTTVRAGNMNYRLLCPASLPAVVSPAGDFDLVASRISLTVLAVTVEGAGSPVLFITDALGANPLSVTDCTLERPNVLFYACQTLTDVTIGEMSGVTLAAGWTAAIVTGGSNASIIAQELLPATATLTMPSDLTVQLPETFYGAFADAGLATKNVSISENGTQTITADAGIKGLHSVELTVNVPSIGGNLQSKSMSVTENGTVTVAPDTGYDGLSAVEVTANVPSGGNAQYDEIAFAAGQATVPTGVLQALMSPGASGIDKTTGLLVDATALGAGIQRVPKMNGVLDGETYTLTFGGFDTARTILAYITATCVMGVESCTFTISYAEFGGTDITAMLGAIPIKLYTIQLPISE